ncbi:hypothetical protein Tco_1256087 [Tanacetum coccineum]
MKWLPKLIGYDYEVIYKMGLKNGAADALCRLGNASELICMFVSSITTVLMQRVKDTGGEVTFYGTIPFIHVPYGGLSKVDTVDRQVTIRQGKQHKFYQKFYGPFEIIAKKYRGPPMPMDSVMLPQCDKEWTLLKKPLKLLDKRIAKKQNRVVVYGLVSGQMVQLKMLAGKI